MVSGNYSILYRVIHWLIAILLFLLIGTVFLRETWLEKNHVAEIIGNYLKENTHQTLSKQQLIMLAKQIRKPMWEWHIYIGYLLCLIFLIRFTLPIFGKMKIQSPFQKGLGLKGKIKNWSYIVFYACVLISLVTGLLIEFGPLYLKSFSKEIHVLSLYYLLAFIAIHWAGVFVAEFGKQQGIISSIISGKKGK